nr:isoform 2 of dna (cytosine-5)-methyltransferase drm2 [Quercus suber]
MRMLLVLRVTTVTGNEDEQEIDNFSLSSSSSLTPPNEKIVTGSRVTSSFAGSFNSKLVNKFIGMGFIKRMLQNAKLTKRIRKALEDNDGEPPLRVQKYTLDECRKWNLVWIGRNNVAPFEPDEVEMLLGFPRNHVREVE